MPVLSNPRHEKFARALAAGKSAAEAYAESDYAPNRHNASRLKTIEHVARRIAEIRAENDQATAKAMEVLGLDRNSVLRSLLEERALGSERGQHGSAIRALELIGKELGLMRRRKQPVLIRRKLGLGRPRCG